MHFLYINELLHGWRLVKNHRLHHALSFLSSNHFSKIIIFTLFQLHSLYNNNNKTNEKLKKAIYPHKATLILDATGNRPTRQSVPDSRTRVLPMVTVNLLPDPTRLFCSVYNTACSYHVQCFNYKLFKKISDSVKYVIDFNQVKKIFIMTWLRRS